MISGRTGAVLAGHSHRTVRRRTGTAPRVIVSPGRTGRTHAARRIIGSNHRFLITGAVLFPRPLRLSVIAKDDHA